MSDIPAPDGVGASKTTISERIDQLSKNSTRRSDFLANLENWDMNYFEVLKNHDVLQSGDEIDHYRWHWFNEDDKGWWKEPKEKFLMNLHRLGMIEAFKASVTLNKPIVSYWILGPKHFRICVSWSERQITRLVLTPEINSVVPDSSEPPGGDSVGTAILGHQGIKQPIRVIRELNKNFKYVDAEGLHPGERFISKHNEHNIVVTRLFGSASGDPKLYD